MKPIPQIAFDIVKSFEGIRLNPYFDSAGNRTIGYGHKMFVSEADSSITEKDALEYLQMDINIAGAAVCRLIKVPLNDNQYAALIDFVFNLGSARLQCSTLRMKLNRGEYMIASNEFAKWCHAGVRILPGLKRRRLAEAKLFNSVP